MQGKIDLKHQQYKAELKFFSLSSYHVIFKLIHKILYKLNKLESNELNYTFPRVLEIFGLEIWIWSLNNSLNSPISLMIKSFGLFLGKYFGFNLQHEPIRFKVFTNIYEIGRVEKSTLSLKGANSFGNNLLN